MKFDIIIIGAGASGLEKGMAKLAEGKRVAIVSAGRSTISIRYAAEDIMDYDARLKEGVKKEFELRNAFRRKGGVLFEGDEVIGANVAEKNGKWEVAGLTTRKLQDETLVADEYYLATGKFFSKGLRSSYMGIEEPIFGLDVIVPQTPAEWIAQDFTAEQPFMKAHVATTENGCGIKGGKDFTNLMCIGTIANN